MVIPPQVWVEKWKSLMFAGIRGRVLNDQLGFLDAAREVIR